MRVIGITGGIATGKTIVSKMVASFLDAPLIDVDRIVHSVLFPRSRVFRKIIGVFGREIVTENESIDRRKLGRIVFSNLSERQKLERIVHPEVKKIIERELENFKERKEKVIVLDIPLLFEAKMEDAFDTVLVVRRDEHLQLKTLQEERGLSFKEAKERIESQMPLIEKVKRADFVIENNGTIEEVERQVNKICTHLKSICASGSSTQTCLRADTHRPISKDKRRNSTW